MSAFEPGGDLPISDVNAGDVDGVIDIDDVDQLDDPDGVDEDVTPTRKNSLRKIVVRVLVMAIGIGVAGVLLVFTFDDLDLDQILDAIKSLDDADHKKLVDEALAEVDFATLNPEKEKA